MEWSGTRNIGRPRLAATLRYQGKAAIYGMPSLGHVVRRTMTAGEVTTKFYDDFF